MFSRSKSFLPPAEMSILFALLNCPISIVAAFMSDWFGRRPLLLISSFGCFLAHSLFAIYFFLEEKTSIEATTCIWMFYLGLVLYFVFSNIGVGPLLQTLQSEMFGSSTRGIAGGVTESLVAVWAFISLKTYTPVSECVGVYLNFTIFAAFGLISGILLWMLMYETNGMIIGQKEVSAVERPSEATIDHL